MVTTRLHSIIFKHCDNLQLVASGAMINEPIKIHFKPDWLS